MSNLLIVYHSQTGNTQQLAQSAHQGALKFPATSTRLVKATQGNARDFRWANAVLLGTPENFGYMSGGLKLFLDEVFYPCETDMVGVPYATFISAGNDGTGAVAAIDRILKGLLMNPVQPPLITTGQLTPAHLNSADELGQTMAAGLDAGIF